MRFVGISFRNRIFVFCPDCQLAFALVQVADFQPETGDRSLQVFVWRSVSWISRRNSRFDIAKRYRFTIQPCPARPAYAVNVRFRDIWYFVVNNQVQIINIDTVGNIGSYQHTCRAILKLFNAFWRAFCDLLPWMASALMWALVSNRCTLSAPCLVRVKPARFLSTYPARYAPAKVFFICRINKIHFLLYRFSGRRCRSYLHLFGIGKYRCSQCTNSIRH